MTPIEKAKKLVEKFSNSLYESNGTGSGAVQCALIAVDEILDELFNSQDSIENKQILRYWQQVKKHLEEL